MISLSCQAAVPLRSNERRNIMNDFSKTNTVHEETLVYFSYKDRVFRMLFKEKERLLELYNALNGTDYADPDQLTVTTLENAIFIKMKNDVSFIIDCNMCLYEHQSTYCPNMPLRGFLYFADLYKNHIRDIDLSVRKQIKIPTPHYIVFYNGMEKEEEVFYQKLSDAFEDDSEGCMELKVKVLNINLGHNKELLEKCNSLYGYSYFVAEIRNNLRTMELPKAVCRALEECIKKDILKEFLLKQKAEVIAMSIYEYNEEYVRKSLTETGYEQGREDGIRQGREDGIRQGREAGITQGRMDGIREGKAETLAKSVEAVMRNLNLDLPKACEIIGTTQEEYIRSKQMKM